MQNKIYTGYYAGNYDMVGIRISLGFPRFAYTDVSYHIEQLYPTEDMLACADRWDVYTRMYTAHIKPIIDDVYSDLIDIAREHKKPVILLCFEKPDSRGGMPCHRRIVADMITSKFGIEIPEAISSPRVKK